MFENYPTYAKQVIAATKKMSAGKKSLGIKTVVASSAAVIAGLGTFAISGSAIEMMQINRALQSVSGDIQSAPVEVKVETDGTTLAELLGDENGLSASEQVQIAEQIKSSIAEEDLSNATGKMIDDNTAEINISTSDGIPVTVKVIKDANGEYKIESVVAQLDKNAAAAQKENINNPNSTDAQKAANATPLPDFAVKDFDSTIGLASDANSEAALGAYARQMATLDTGLVMAVPSAFEAQEVEQPEEATQEADADKSKDKKEAEETSGEFVTFKPYNRSWKTTDGSSISVRAENLGEAFSQMNGLDAVNKMMGYWKETAESVANGAGQEMKDPDAGFTTKVFYDEKTGLWGYWGTVSFTDGNRDIVYNRVVFIDELSDQMITVSYRHDGEPGKTGALSLEDYQKLFFHAPVSEEGTHAKEVVATYAEKLKEIGIEDKNASNKDKKDSSAAKVEVVED